jgi:hypothetical protein
VLKWTHSIWDKVLTRIHSEKCKIENLIILKYQQGNQTKEDEMMIIHSVCQGDEKFMERFQ